MVDSIPPKAQPIAKPRLGLPLRKASWGVEKKHAITNRLSGWPRCLVLVGIISVWRLAHDENSNTKSEVRTLTGCLTNQYRLTASDASTSEMHQNGSVDLAEHVGQSVEVKGTASHPKMHNVKQDAKEMGHGARVNNNTAERGHLHVTDIHRVGESCER